MYNPNEFHLFHNILYYLFEKKLKLKRWYYHFTVTLNHPIKTRTVLSHANSYGNYYEIFPSHLPFLGVTCYRLDCDYVLESYLHHLARFSSSVARFKFGYILSQKKIYNLVSFSLHFIIIYTWLTYHVGVHGRIYSGLTTKTRS